MLSFSEYRPEFFYRNTFEFTMHGFKPGFLNIYLGFVVILVICYCLLRSRQSFHVKLLALYFSLSFFTNFAYQLYYGARIFDFIGIVISLIMIAKFSMSKVVVMDFEKKLFSVIIILFIHLLILHLLGYFDKYASGNGIFIQRVIMICRLGVLFCVSLYFTNHVKREEQVRFIVKVFKYTGLATLLIMMLQEILFFQFDFKTIGLNFASGHIPLPRFSSVANEAGHFGKLIPTFIIYFMFQKKNFLKITPFFVFLLFVSLTNISISLYGYLIFFFFSMIAVSISIQKIRGLKTFTSFIIIGMVIIITQFYSYFLLFYWKLCGLLFHYGEKYDHTTYRSPGFLYNSLAEFPLGIGFGVSDRNLPDGSFTSLGIYALISQLSFVSVIVLFLFFFYWYKIIRLFLRYKSNLEYKPYAIHSFLILLVIPLFFVFNIVWLYPGYILPFLVLTVYINREEMRYGNRLPK